MALEYCSFPKKFLSMCEGVKLIAFIVWELWPRQKFKMKTNKEQ